jgi:pyruvate dehydrogenase E2 component (dihydrolipoamide acetyltransferase)
VCRFGLKHTNTPALQKFRGFHSSLSVQGIKSVKLTDIGEGTAEAQIVQWFVKEGAPVKEWDRLCEVTTDKAMTDVS